MYTIGVDLKPGVFDSDYASRAPIADTLPKSESDQHLCTTQPKVDFTRFNRI